ncbi:SANT/Myb domain [Sesbania bispinosa]|nr:SANT/Myb domain [Sesbania bispinosa]
MHGKKDQEHIRKGPWKAEEDEVLLNHVKKYGPRDWSSIRSKGLLQRTGKSCRLRWVNKLRPNLKKYSVYPIIHGWFKAQFGNKWAKIASYLSGRTDNDVKNFWSSRQKRLARILQTSATNSKSQKNKTKVPTLLDVPTLEAPKLSSSSEGEPSSKPQSSSLSCIENSEVIKMVPLPDLIKSLPSSDTSLVEQEFITPYESYKTTEQISFPQISEVQTDLTFLMGSQDLLPRIDESSFIDVFGPLDTSEFGMGPQHPIGFPFFEPTTGSCRIGNTIDNYKNGDSFFDDFPEDLFDHMEPPASPPKL